jgi:hypothetical protein
MRRWGKRRPGNEARGRGGFIDLGFGIVEKKEGEKLGR